MVARIALTLGEPAGVGPDICLKVATQKLPYELIIIGSAELLIARAKQLNIPIELYSFDPNEAPRANGQSRLAIVDVALKAKCIAGELNIANSAYVLNTLQAAASLCLNKHTQTLVTAPIHKGIIQSSGVIFSGHTEYLADLTGVEDVLMTFFTPDIMVGMATTHCPLNKVSSLLTERRLRQALVILHQNLISLFDIPHPRITVLGLNPHAGEGGQIGDEEQKLMIPVINALKAQGLQLQGPVSGDTAFTTENRNQADAILAIYHDQGIGPIKALYFNQIVNLTLGLPFLRTSVDHGTALSLAGTGLANENSLQHALSVALKYGTHATAAVE